MTDEETETGEDFENVMKFSITNGTKAVDIGVWSEGSEKCRELFDHMVDKTKDLIELVKR